MAQTPQSGTPATATDDDARIVLAVDRSGQAFTDALISRLSDRAPSLAARIAVHVLGDETPVIDQVRLVAFVLDGASGEAFEAGRLLARRAALSWIPALGAPARGPTGAVRTPDAEALRADFRARDPQALFARLHHRKRAVVICGEVINAELLVGHEADVNAASCLFAPARRWTGGLAARLGRARRSTAEAVAADRTFAETGPDAAAALSAACREAGLDFATVEYSATAQGGVAIWRVAPFAGFQDLAFGLMVRRRALDRREARILDRFAEALETALGRELDAPIAANGRRAA